MAASKQLFNLPGYGADSTNDIDVYSKAWKDLAAPIERNMLLTLEGFDPTFRFRQGNAQGQSIYIDLPVWFVKILGAKFEHLENNVKT